MEDLYQSVIKGDYKKLPSHFSVDLNNFISMMLKVNPAHRASADKLLALPVIKKRMNATENSQGPNDLNPNMLQTIRMPNNIHYLTDRLPKANYKSLAESSLPLDKERSLIDVERTLPVLGRNDEILDKEEKNHFLSEIRQQSGRARVLSGIGS